MDQEELRWRQKLAEDNHNMIYAYMKKHNVPSEDYDIVAEGFWKACLSYNPAVGKLSTIAYLRMLHETCMEFRKKHTTTRVPQEQIVYYNEKISEDSEATFENLISADYNMEKHVEDSDFIKWFLHTCKVRDLNIIYLYLSGYTQVQISHDLGLSQAHVSKILRTIGQKIQSGQSMYVHQIPVEPEKDELIRKVLSLL